MDFPRRALARLTGGPVRQRLLLGFATGTAASLATLALFATGFFRTLEDRTADARFRIERATSGGAQADRRPPIVIVDVDNESLRLYQHDLGRWPWPREIHAAVLDYLALGEPRAVAFDFLFSEPDRGNAAGDTAFATST
ncbi:MAG: CHASE2 domain-containing protein, partial [Gemmatimonadetes bacterium]|nr:CHASE2 domain-containing protein [Gemmatimonadota bacterium]